MKSPLKTGQQNKVNRRGQQSFSARLRDMHPNQIASLLIRVDAKISKQPNNPKLYFDKALALMKLKMFKEAVDTLKKSIDLNPESPSAHFQIGNAFLEMGRLKLAKKGFEQAISKTERFSVSFPMDDFEFDGVKYYQERDWQTL